MAVAYLYHDELQTKRLITRFLTPEDILSWAQFFKDKEALEFLSTFGMDSCENMSKHWVERQLSRYNQNRFGLQALINKSTDGFIGQCGLINQEIDKKWEMEISYHIFKKDRKS